MDPSTATTSGREPVESDVVPHRRQVEILRLVARGLTAKEIAALLFVEECTVKTHLYKLYRLVGARNAPHAVAIGMVRGWLQ